MTYPNLNNRQTEKVATGRYDYYQGPKFNYSDNTKYLLNLADGKTHFSISSGRYTSLQFQITGSGENVSTQLSLADFNETRGSEFSTLE